MSPFPTSKGHLNPGSAVRMTRLAPGPDAADLVRHYWVPQWDLPPGRTERQLVLGYPACNLVVQPDAVILSGPTTRATHRDLAGHGWAVGALLRPAAGPALLNSGLFGTPVTVAEIVDRQLTADAAELRRPVVAAMTGVDLTRAVAAVERFLLELRPGPTVDGLLANRAQQLIENSPLSRGEEVAVALAVSSRSLQRLTRAYVGLTPSAMIRRRRLQDAAEVLRLQPEADLTTVALAHGYADHAHLTREFGAVLGFTPSHYRARR